VVESRTTQRTYLYARVDLLRSISHASSELDGITDSPDYESMLRVRFAFLLLPLLACGSSSGSGSDAGPGADSAPVSDARPFADAAPNQLGCSEDLHEVLDANGNVLETCPLDQGCSVGECVPACEAAAESGGNVGCDFYVSTPHFLTQIAPPCFAAFVTNNWGSPTNISISRDGQNYSASEFGRISDGTLPESQWAPVPATGLPADDVAVLFLSQDPSSVNGTPLTCPVAPAISVAGGTAAGVGNGNVNSTTGIAWHIQTDVPVSLYDILPYGGAASFLPSAQLVMPESALGDNFVVSLPKTSGAGAPWLQVLATEDNTAISVLPNIDFPAGAVLAAAPGVTSTFTVNAGEYIQWQFATNSNASGSILSSDKPIAVVGGDTLICYSSLTSTGGGCDSAHQEA
jgi:hypothetical protein